MILKRNLRNAIRKAVPGANLAFTMKNFPDRGHKLGCRGFVKNMDNGSLVYVNAVPYTADGMLYCRYVEEDEGYTGGRNHCISNSLDAIAREVAGMVSKTPEEYGEIRLFKGFDDALDVFEEVPA